jgi:hypothetical protein
MDVSGAVPAMLASGQDLRPPKTMLGALLEANQTVGINSCVSTQAGLEEPLPT